MRKYTRQLKYTRSHPTRAPLAHYKTMTQIAHAVPRERNTGLRTDTRHEHDATRHVRWFETLEAPRPGDPKGRNTQIHGGARTSRGGTIQRQARAHNAACALVTRPSHGPRSGLTACACGPLLVHGASSPHDLTIRHVLAHASTTSNTNRASSSSRLPPRQTGRLHIIRPRLLRGAIDRGGAAYGHSGPPCCPTDDGRISCYACPNARSEHAHASPVSFARVLLHHHLCSRAVAACCAILAAAAPGRLGPPRFQSLLPPRPTVDARRHCRLHISPPHPPGSPEWHVLRSLRLSTATGRAFPPSRPRHLVLS